MYATIEIQQAQHCVTKRHKRGQSKCGSYIDSMCAAIVNQCVLLALQSVLPVLLVAVFALQPIVLLLLLQLLLHAHAQQRLLFRRGIAHFPAL